MYRDTSNYKKYARVVFAGHLTSDEKASIVNELDQGMFFIPEQVDLSNPREEFENHYDDDHVWNEVLDIADTDDAPTDGRSITEFCDELRAVTWDPALAHEVLQSWMNATPNGALLEPTEGTSSTDLTDATT
jgi:hypothetical protein